MPAAEQTTTPTEFGIFKTDQAQQPAPPTEPGQDHAQQQQAQPAQPTEPTKVTDPGVADRSWNKLVERERQLEEKRREIKTVESEIAEYRALKDAAQKDPRTAVLKLGVDPMAIVDSLLGEKPTQQDQSQSELQQLRAELASLKEELQGTKLKTDRETFRANEIAKIKKLIEENKSQYALSAKLNANGDYSANDIFEAAVNHVRAYGQMPDYKELVERSEKIYEENLFGQIFSLLSDNEIYERYVKKHGHPGGQQKTVAPKTISTNSVEPNKAERELNDDERFARAKAFVAAALKNEGPETVKFN